MVRRSAFTMIELIFAIVIIAITVLSLPMMTQITSRGMERGLVQEAIFASSAELLQALSYTWDQFSMPVDNNTSLAYVLNISGDCNLSAPFNKRPGHASRSCLNDLTIMIPANEDSNTTPNIHNVLGNKNLFFIAAGDSGRGYKQQYQITLGANNPTSFGSLNNNRNIKRITAIVRDADGNTITQLESYTFNIGDYDPIRRSF